MLLRGRPPPPPPRAIRAFLAGGRRAQCGWGIDGGGGEGGADDVSYIIRKKARWSKGILTIYVKGYTIFSVAPLLIIFLRINLAP